MRAENILSIYRRESGFVAATACSDKPQKAEPSFGYAALTHANACSRPERKVIHSVHKGARDLARDLARDIATTDAYVTSRRQRKKVEMLLVHLKRILTPDRSRLRGSNGARDEFRIAPNGKNLLKMAKLIPMPAQPQPA